MEKIFDPNKSLINLGVVRLSIAMIFIAAIFSFFVVINGQNMIFRLDYVGLKFAIEYFGVPISICALSIPVVALLATNHRSEQTREQIRTASIQNTFANYHKHMEEFEKYLIRTHERIQNLADLNKVGNGPIETANFLMRRSLLNFSFVDSHCYRQLYIKIYRDSVRGDYSISSNFLNKIELFIRFFFKELDIIGLGDIDSRHTALIKINAEIEKFVKSNFLHVSSHVNLQSMRGLANLMKEIIAIVDIVLKYDPYYNPSVWVDKILRTNFDVLPNEKFEKFENCKYINIREMLNLHESAFR
ncbi:hypothetical protein [Janthinobacterium sp. J1-1]|uniref:hypothetical protein n=1 Tax=Janthinobacterium sp. J1-1 TaxID=3065910 RepID=UPI00281208A3|nr:hypothetical protein [Janthinobacterium sp. J1-1]